MSQNPSLEDEDKAFKLSEEAMVKAETEPGANYDGHLPGRLRQFSQASFRKIFARFSHIKNVGRRIPKGAFSGKIEFSHIKNIGRRIPKGAFLISIILLSVTLFGSISVLGLLQSTERVNALGINIPISSTPPTYPPLPPPTLEPKIKLDRSIDIYGDSSGTKAISNIKWGSIEVGSYVSETIYIKNSGLQSIILSLYIENWDPVESSNYMDLSWDYDGSLVEPGSVVEVTLTLTADSSISGIEKFGFEILIIGSSS